MALLRAHADAFNSENPLDVVWQHNFRREYRLAFAQDSCAQFRDAWEAPLLLGRILAQAEQFVAARGTREQIAEFARFERELMPTLVIRRFGAGGDHARFFRALEF